VYDDGNYRASPFDPPVSNFANYSRAVEYAINEQTMEVAQVWQYGQDVPETLFTVALGNADWLTNTDHVLVTFGDVNVLNYNPPDTNAPGATMIRIQEVTHDPTPEVVFDLSFFDYDYPGLGYYGYWTYRSHRVPDLYPHPAVPVADLTVSYSGGVPLLQFSADPARSYLVETSSDLKNWSVLGAAQTEAGGLYDFYDVDAVTSGSAAARYYRVWTQ
jgi:hypothetical protein